MMMTVNEDDTCRSCGLTYGWHVKNTPKHPFNAGQAGATDFLKRPGARDPGNHSSTSQQGTQGPQMVLPGGDPVVRIALINKGILTPADLMAAEEALRQALANVQKEGPWSAAKEEKPDSFIETVKTSTEL